MRVTDTLSRRQLKYWFLFPEKVASYTGNQIKSGGGERTDVIYEFSEIRNWPKI